MSTFSQNIPGNIDDIADDIGLEQTVTVTPPTVEDISKPVDEDGNVTENNVKNVFQNKDFVKLQYTTRPGKCSVHHDRDSEYFCEECKRAICGYCRFKGGHSKGTQSLHQLEDIYLTFTKNNNQNQENENEKKKWY